MDTVTVIFHEDNLLGKPLYICEMPMPPRVGEEVALSVRGLAGTVLRVGWEIAAEGIFAEVNLKIYTRHS